MSELIAVFESRDSISRSRRALNASATFTLILPMRMVWRLPFASVNVMRLVPFLSRDIDAIGSPSYLDST